MGSQRSGTERLKGQIRCGSEQIRQDAAFYDLPAQHDFYCWSRVRRSSKLLDQLNGLNRIGKAMVFSLLLKELVALQCSAKELLGLQCAGKVCSGRCTPLPDPLATKCLHPILFVKWSSKVLE